MRKFLILVSLLLVLFSCKKEQIVEVEASNNWKSHPDFIYDDVVQMNSYATAEYLYFLGYTSFSAISNDLSNNPDVSGGENITFYLNWYDQPSQEKLPICDDYFVSYVSHNGYLIFIPTANPFNGSTSASFSMSDIDSTFHCFDFLPYSSGECIVINNQNQALVPYKSIIDSNISIKFALVDITKKILGDVRLDTLKTKTIAIPGENENSIIAIESVDSYFFFTASSNAYRIDSLGNIVKVLDTRLYRIIEVSGVYYGIGNENIFISYDNGLTWQKGYSLQFEHRMINYTKVDDRIIGYRYGQLWEFLISDTEMTPIELDNEGLDGKSITSVSKFNGKVYLSTMSGVYYKSIAEFFKPKSE